MVPYGVEARRITVDWLNAATAVVIVPCVVPLSQYSVVWVVSPITCPPKL